MYADDLTLMIQFPDSNDLSKRKTVTEKLIQKYLNECDKWSKIWGLNFNPDKCEYIIVGNKQKEVDLNLLLYGKGIKRADSIKVLGLTIENMKSAPLGKMEDEARRKLEFTYSQLKTFFKKPGENSRNVFF